MRPVLTLLPTLVGVAVAAELSQLVAQLPDCSVKCLVTSAMGEGCGATDYKCQCSKLEAINKVAAPCMVKAGCQLKQLGEVADTITAICAQVAPQQGGQTANQPAADDSAKTPNVPSAASRSVIAGWSGAAAVAVIAAML